MAEGNVDMKDAAQETVSRQGQEPRISGGDAMAKTLDVIGWGAFLVWLGFVMLVSLDKGWIIFGIGLIIIGVQIARLVKNLSLERFWLVTGLLFILGAVIDFLGARWLVPILLILSGIALVLVRLLPRHQS